MALLTFFVKRLIWLLLTLWVVFTISFILMRLVPGGPYSEERKTTPEIERNIRARYHLDEPLLTQYALSIPIRFRAEFPFVVIDFGPSYKLEDYNVNEVIAQGFPVSASLGIFAMVFALTIGTSAGIISAIRRNTLFDYVAMAIATVGIAVPNFVIASLLIILFVFTIHIFPAGGWGTVQQLVLPAICLGIAFAGSIARLTRTGMMEVLSQDYIRTAYAKGLSERAVVIKHALRGALIPVVSYLGPATAGVLTGSLVLERIFALPGMGSHFIEAALQRDYPMAMGMIMVYTTLLFSMNALVDLSYAVLDPRVKIE